MKSIRSRSPFAAALPRVVAVLYGLLDSSVWIASYGYNVDGGYFSLYYAVAVPLKAAILIVFIRTARVSNARLLWPFCVPIGISILASIIMGNTGLEGVVQPVGMIASLAMTLMILNDESIFAYMKAFGISCLLACAAFLFQLNFVPLNTTLGIWEESGRYSFIFGTQPNLGGEVLFTGFVAFCVARLNAALVVAVFVLFFVTLNLLESRAALLSILLALSAYLYMEKIRGFSLGSRMALASALVLCLIGFCLLFSDRIADLFLFNDEYRGFGTGYVGREDRWEVAWEIFLESPLFGIGFEYFRHVFTTPHSMWMNMLTMIGLMSVFVVIPMFKNGLRIYAANTEIFFLLLSFVPMTIFNDRFLNLNPYPFLLFVLLFLPRKALLAGIEARELHRKVDAGVQRRRFGNMNEGARV
jgi:O-Antigen ligase